MCVCMCACQTEFIWISLQSLPITQVINQQGWWSPHPSMLPWVQMPTQTPSRLATLRYRKEMKRSFSPLKMLQTQKSQRWRTDAVKLPSRGQNGPINRALHLYWSSDQKDVAVRFTRAYTRDGSNVRLHGADRVRQEVRHLKRSGNLVVVQYPTYTPNPVSKQDNKRVLDFPRLMLLAQICFTGSAENVFLFNVAGTNSSFVALNPI